MSFLTGFIVGFLTAVALVLIWIWWVGRGIEV